MFGETESESPRMPSPWEAIATPPPYPPTPSRLSSSLNVRNQFEDSSSANRDAPYHNSNVVQGTHLAEMPLLDADIVINSQSTFLKLSPEIEEGNVEYKLKLINPTPERFARLVTQLKYRLLEGGGQALYEIGVSDSGQLIGLSRNELNESLDTLERMAGELGATVVVLKEIELPDGSLPAPPSVIMLPAKATKKPKQNGKGGLRATATRRKRTIPQTNASESSDSGVQGTTPSTSTSDSPIDSGVDLNPTITASLPVIDALPTVQAMPVIKPYPYGHRPFTLWRSRDTSPNPQRPLAPITSSHIKQYTYNVTPDSRGPFPPERSRSDAASADDDDEDDGGFGFDLEISSFTKTMPLAPSPHVKPASAKKPLHYTSFLTESATANSQPCQQEHHHVFEHTSGDSRLPPPRTKPIVVPTYRTPMEKAAERRMKRDAKREIKKVAVNEGVDVQIGGVANDQTSSPTISITPPQDPLVSLITPDPNTMASNVGESVGNLRVIAEALVVRKLALEEAYLDFGGFDFVLPGLSPMAAGSGA